MCDEIIKAGEPPQTISKIKTVEKLAHLEAPIEDKQEEIRLNFTCLKIKKVY